MKVSSEHFPAEPDCDLYPYAGWVPTAVGRLSFRPIGEAEHPTRSVYANVLIQGQRHVLAYQRRDVSDVLFKPLVHRLKGLEGSFWFSLAASSVKESHSSNEINGYIFIHKSKMDWLSTAESIVRPAIKIMNETRLSHDADRDNILKSWNDCAVRTLKFTADTCIKFKLFRSGEVFFSRPEFSDNVLGRESVDYANKYGIDFQKWIADQSYFFLRDISHKHQHHSSHIDTMLVLQKHTSDGVKWRSNILFTLYHNIICAKRRSDAESYHQALGILGYAKSYKKNCQKALKEKSQEIPPFNDEALQQSLASRSEQIWLQDQRDYTQTSHGISKFGNAIMMFAMFLAVIIMIAQFGVEEHRPEYLINISHSILEHPIIYIFIFASLLISYGIAVSRHKIPFLGRGGIGKENYDILILTQTGNQWPLVISCVILLIIISSTFFVANEAIQDIESAILPILKLI